MTTTMRALRKLEAGPGLTLTDIPLPDLGPRDVRIRVHLAGICGTDKHIHDWDAWAASRITPPVTVGHEFVGTVEALGSAVSRVALGQRVAGEGHIGCGRCEPCRTGNGHICESVDIIGVDRDGTFAEHLVLPEDNVWPLDPAIPDEVAAILDPLGNAMHTVMAAGVSGRSVLVTGAGVIGLMSIAIARAAGAGTIVATDVDARRLERARAMGADETFLAGDPEWPAKVRALTAGEGAQVLLEMSGAPSALRGGFTALRNGGRAALLGLPSRPVELDLANDIIFKGATVLGINGRLMYETWFQVESFLTTGRLDIRSLITDVLPLEEHEEAFRRLSTGDAVKVLLRVS
jgi:threonine 3-dehydrogenase